ncbi:MAG: hypothetical protein FRX49_07959 [Trebouxia sp. A1-2]|nr:MAG: hypothetical protein FRX49_07959 [Trebouxia sp. A1-2]
MAAQGVTAKHTQRLFHRDRTRTADSCQSANNAVLLRGIFVDSLLTGSDHMEVLNVTYNSFGTWHIDVMPTDELWWLKPLSHGASPESSSCHMDIH